MGSLVEPRVARSRPGLVSVGALPADHAANRRPRPGAPCRACAQLRYDAVYATTTQPGAAVAVLRFTPNLGPCLRIGGEHLLTVNGNTGTFGAGPGLVRAHRQSPASGTLARTRPGSARAAARLAGRTGLGTCTPGVPTQQNHCPRIGARPSTVSCQAEHALAVRLLEGRAKPGSPVPYPNGET